MYDVLHIDLKRKKILGFKLQGKRKKNTVNSECQSSNKNEKSAMVRRCLTVS